VSATDAGALRASSPSRASAGPTSYLTPRAELKGAWVPLGILQPLPWTMLIGRWTAVDAFCGYLLARASLLCLLHD
jgi:hypothetical protein